MMKEDSFSKTFSEQLRELTSNFFLFFTEARIQQRFTKYLEELTSAGEEGVMINICDALYEFKRTTNLLKVKKMNTLDLEIVGVEEGEGRLAGTLELFTLDTGMAT